MNWSDEHYVKLYTRETLTWRSWGWEARTVFLHLLKCVDHSGFIETGRMEPAAALALQLMLPSSVVAPGLAELVDSGTVELFDSALLIPKFVEAQEARKTDAQKKRDERSRNIAKRRGSMSPAVTGSHPLSPAVTQRDPPAQPSPAQIVPSPAQPEKLAGKKPPAVPLAHQETIDRIWAAWKRVKGCAYTTAPRGADFKAVKELLAAGQTPEGIEAAWSRALTHAGFPTVSNVVELQQHFGKFVGPPRGAKPVADPDQDFPLGVIHASSV